MAGGLLAGPCFAAGNGDVSECEPGSALEVLAGDRRVRPKGKFRSREKSSGRQAALLSTGFPRCTRGSELPQYFMARAASTMDNRGSPLDRSGSFRFFQLPTPKPRDDFPRELGVNSLEPRNARRGRDTLFLPIVRYRYRAVETGRVLSFTPNIACAKIRYTPRGDGTREWNLQNPFSRTFQLFLMNATGTNCTNCTN